MRLYTKVLGIFFLIIGVGGFLPVISSDGGNMLLGFIRINPAQSVIHILTGIVALGALAAAKDYYIATYVRVFAVVYTLVALWGLPGLMGNFDSVLFGLIHVNWATELVHIVVAVWGLTVGFALKNRVGQAA